MVLALDPTVRRVWRTPDSLQFGVGRPRVVLENVSSSDEIMIAALDNGVTPEVLRLVADRSGAPPGALEALIERLQPVLAPPPVDPPRHLVVLDGDGPTAAALAGMLTSAAVEVRGGLAWSDPLVDTASAAVIVGSYAIEPRRHARWLRRDIPHLPVVFGDEGVTVGPFAHPGAGPCLRCVELRRTEEDPAWPAMASQLYTLGHPGETPIVAAATAALAATAVLGVVLHGHGDRADASEHYDADSGRWSRRRWEPHPECGCRALPSATVSRGGALPPEVAAPPGIETAGGAPGTPAGCRARPS